MSAKLWWGERRHERVSRRICRTGRPADRQPGRHSLHNILVIALCTVISGGQTCTGMELYGHAKRDLLQSCHIALSLDLRNSENI